MDGLNATVFGTAHSASDMTLHKKVERIHAAKEGELAVSSILCATDEQQFIANEVRPCETHTALKMEDTLSHEKSFFVEKSEVLAILSSLNELAESSFEGYYDRLLKIFDNYQEQPQLLGPHIEELLVPLNDLLVRGIHREVVDVRFHLVCRVVQTICKVRGFKQCSKYFPHEVYHMEPCIQFLKKQNTENYELWEVRYVLLLWLSTLSLIPFDISSLDSSGSEESLVADLIETARAFLKDSGPTREAAAICLSSLLTRPDLQGSHLTVHLKWSIDILTPSSAEKIPSSQFLLLGTLHCLTQLYKRGHREKLLQDLTPIFDCSFKMCEESSQTAERKYLCKLIQRLGMTLLPTREAAWRYQRGRRTLNLQPLVHGSIDLPKTENADTSTTATTELWDVPEVMEEVIEHLLRFLSDKDTIVRWSAAKGIGRVSMRLPKVFVDEVVSAIITFFDDEEDDSRWHGGCLALAELTRRGLLLPENLSTVVPLVLNALHFDTLRGQHGVGAHVRDAASYVCWSFARAYSPSVMNPYVQELSVSMLCAVLFDREVNCRRAAAAAFQENVGRQGHENFAHGVEIIQILDYFSVGNRTACYLEHSTTVADLESYFAQSFIAFLLRHKVCHWDKEIRDLATKAVAKIIAVVGGMGADAFLIDLVRDTQSSSLVVRHGSLLCIARLVQMLSSIGQNISESSAQSIETLILEMEKRRLFRGRGSELVREAACSLVESLAHANVSVSLKAQVSFVEFLNDQLRQPHESVQKAAQDALRHCLFSFFGSFTKGEPSERLQNLTWRRYVDGLRTEQNVAVTRGFALALGSLPVRILTQPIGALNTILSTLESLSNPQYKIAGEYDAETCRAAVESAQEIFKKLCGLAELTDERILRFLEIFLRGCGDYNVDKRGDTGSWARMASLKAFAGSLRGISLVYNGEVDWIETAFGPAKPAVNSLFVCFPPKSFGADTASKYGWMSLHLQHDNNVHVKVHFPCVSRVVSHVLPDQVLTKVYSQTFKLLAEKLDSVRQVAGEALVEIVNVRRKVVTTTTERFVCELLDDEKASNFIANWARPDHVFPFVCRALQCDDLVHPVIQGIIVSIGGLTESISKEASRALFAHCSCRQADFVKTIAFLLVRILADNSKQDRIALPLLKSIDILGRMGLFNSLHFNDKQEWEISLHSMLWNLLRLSTNIPKIMVCIDLIGILSTSSVGNKAITSLANMLGHRYPRIRKYVSELLYVVLIGLDEFSDADEVLATLTDTRWDTVDQSIAQQQKQRICNILGVECVMPSTGCERSSRPSAVVDELDSYGSLVRDAGY